MRTWWAAFIGNKQVNGRALLILILALVVGLGGTYLVHGFQVRRNAGGLLEQAGVTEGDGDKIQAILYLEQYLGLMPGDGEATAKLALLLSQETKNPRAQARAYLLYDDLLRREEGSAADRLLFRRQAAKLAMRRIHDKPLRPYAEAKQQLQELVDESGGVADADTLQLQGQAEEGLGNFAEAEKFYDEATKKGEYQPEMVGGYARFLRKVGRNPTKADVVIRELVARHGNSFAARLEAARYFSNTGQVPLAQKHLKFIVHDLGKPTEEVRLLEGNIELDLGNLEKARDLFEKGRQLNPSSAALARGLAHVELRKHEPGEALALLKPTLRALPTDVIELWDLANLLIGAHADDKARTVLAHLKKLHQYDGAALIDYTEARLRMAEGQWGEAAGQLARARSDARISASANLLLAQCSDHLLNPDQKMEALRRAVAQEPGNVTAGRELAQAQAAQGELESAGARLRGLLAKGVPVRTELARLLLDRARRASDPRLLKEAEQLLNGTPRAAQWFAPLPATAGFAFGLGPWQTTAMLLARPEPTPETKDAVGVALLKADLGLLQGKPVAQIRGLVEAERDRDPTQTAPWLFLVWLAEREKRPAQAFELLDQAEARNGPHVEWSLTRVTLLLRAGPDFARKGLPRLRANVALLPKNEQARLRAALANAFRALGETKTASTLWKKIVDDDPDNLQAAFAYFESLLQLKELNELKDLDGARELLTNIKRIEGDDGAITAYCEGALRLSQARGDHKLAGLAEAHAFFARAAKLRPTWAKVPLLEAAAYQLEGQKEKELEKLRAALDHGEQRLSVVKRALQLMEEQGQYGEGVALLDKITNKQALETPELGRLAAQITFLGAGADGQDPKVKRRQALAQARNVAAKSNDYIDQMLLGRMASLTGDPNDLAEAEKALRKACELKPTAPEAWRELVSLLARTDPKRGAEALAKAQHSLSKDDAALVSAMGYDALGQSAKADERFQALCDAKPHDAAVVRAAAAFFARQNKSDKAARTLEKFLQSAPADRATKVWAQRSLAIMLAAQRDPKRLAEAESLLAQADAIDPDSAESRIARAQFLLAQPARRADAVQALERMQDALPDALRFALAQLYEADGNWAGAQRQLLILLRGDEHNAAYLDRYVSGLLRHHDIQAAQLWVDKLAQTAPKALHTLELRIQILLAAKQTPAAVKLVEEYAVGKDARPELAARWFELVGRSDDAEKSYRAFVAASKKPESPLVLAQFLGRHKKAAEALAICDRAGPDCRLDAVARTRVTILRGGSADKSQWQAVEDWLKNAIAKKKDQPNEALPFRFLLAELYEYSKRPNDSIRVYRDILKGNPKHVPALNNLAYVIALSPPYATAEGLKLINQAIDIAGTNAELLDTRAVIYLKKQQPAMALQDLRQASGDNLGAVRYFHLAQARYENKDKAGAADAWGKAMDLGLPLTSIHPLEVASYELLEGRSRLGW